MKWYSFAASCCVLVQLVVASRLCGTEGEQPTTSVPARCRLPCLDDDAAWQRLPRIEGEVAHRRLPIWAKALAGPLPHTTAALLELDDLYRSSEAFDPQLRAKMRWVAARANQCTYGQKYAEADLLRAGLTGTELDRLEASLESLPPNERAAITFADKLTRSASTITDEEVAQLIGQFGEQAVVAMVLQVAHANFQDRLLLALNADVEPDGPLPPLAVRFSPPAAGASLAAERPEHVRDNTGTAPVVELGREWTSVTFEELLLGMERQRLRQGRVSVPTWEDTHPHLPAELYPADWPVRIKWSLVVLGHQPQMGAAWLKCLRTFAREAKQDRVFEETLFWVITRTIDCFY